MTSYIAISVACILVACAARHRDGFNDDAPLVAAPPDGAPPSGGAFDTRDREGGAPRADGCVPDAANYDVPGNDCDDDNDGTVDNSPSCEDGLGVDGDAEDFARSLGICTKATDKSYGLVRATFTDGFGTTGTPADEQHGILRKFGNIIKPTHGSALGVLSTGFAREYNGQGNEPFGGVSVFMGYALPAGKDWRRPGALPSGFPKPAAGCPQDSKVRDAIVLSLEMKAPRNAAGVKFDFNFYSGEWPAFICSSYNDGFLAYLTVKGENGAKADNISFDKDHNPVSVNNGFFDRCTPNARTGCALGAKPATSICPGGPDELGGTGFGIEGEWCGAGQGSSTNGGATGWLTSQAPIQPGETFTLEFMIWDTGDGVLDSSVLLDHFTWAASAVPTSTSRLPK